MIRYDPDTNAFSGTTGDGEINIPQVMWHVTDVCPLGCPYCFAPKTTDETSSAECDQIIQRLKQFGVLKVDIAGGEPLIFKGLPAVVGALEQAGIYQTITTSGVGSALNRDFIVANARKFVRVIISLDAPTADEHNELRRHKMAWQMATATAAQLNEVGSGRIIRVNTVITRPFIVNSWTHEMAEMISRLNVREWCLIQPHPAFQKPKFDEYSISNEAFQSVIREATASSRPYNIIHRKASDYSSYWVLHPAGTLTQHTNSDTEGASFNIMSTNVADACAIIRSTKTSAPGLECTSQ